MNYCEALRQPVVNNWIRIHGRSPTAADAADMKREWETLVAQWRSCGYDVTSTSTPVGDPTDYLAALDAILAKDSFEPSAQQTPAKRAQNVKAQIAKELQLDAPRLRSSMEARVLLKAKRRGDAKLLCKTTHEILEYLCESGTQKARLKGYYDSNTGTPWGDLWSGQKAAQRHKRFAPECSHSVDECIKRLEAAQLNDDSIGYDTP